MCSANGYYELDTICATPINDYISIYIYTIYTWILHLESCNPRLSRHNEIFYIFKRSIKKARPVFHAFSALCRGTLYSFRINMYLFSNYVFCSVLKIEFLFPMSQLGYTIFWLSQIWNLFLHSFLYFLLYLLLLFYFIFFFFFQNKRACVFSILLLAHFMQFAFLPFVLFFCENLIKNLFATVKRAQILFRLFPSKIASVKFTI